MIFNICTDPHLGLSRKTHTTRNSAQQWSRMLFESAVEAVRNNGPTILNGDLFDRTHNTEEVIAQGILVANYCEFILAGNHDQPNRADALSSLDIVDEVTSNIVKQQVFDQPYFSEFNGMFFVPHHPTQELFLAAVNAAENAAKSKEGYKYLFVHCNRGELPNITEETLTIMDDREDELIGTFSRIFYGHIHQPSIEKDGQVIVLGNIFPTSFGDITHKFLWRLDAENNELTKEVLFDANKSFKKLTLGEDTENLDQLFFEIEGAGSRTEVAEYLQQVWDNNHQALAVRANCTFTENGVIVKDVDLSDLHNVICEGLDDEAMLELYLTIRGQLNAAN